MPRGDLAPKISLAGVGKTFITRDREVEALQPIDLTILDHEFVALVGPSGCGKSTILNLIAGLLQPSGGVVSYDGVAVNELNRQVGYMTQKDTLLPWRTAADNIRIALELRCRAVPRAEPIADFMTSKRLPLISALLASMAKFCDDGSIAIVLCEP